MQITIERQPLQDSPKTFGKLYINDVYFCDTLEDRDRGLFSTDTIQYINSIKVKHETAIPYGTYQLVLSFSNKFQKYLPELLNVLGFAGIRMHSGTTEEDSSGCVLLGLRKGDKIINSRVTVQKLLTLLSSTVKKEKVFVTIKQFNDGSV